MSVVWEEPPNPTKGSYSRERSPLRKEMDMMLDELRQRPDQWARLWDMPDKEEADKRAMGLRSVSGKGWGIAVRQSPFGWSVYAKFKTDQPETGTEREATFQ